MPFYVGESNALVFFLSFSLALSLCFNLHLLLSSSFPEKIVKVPHKSRRFRSLMMNFSAFVTPVHRDADFSTPVGFVHPNVDFSTLSSQRDTINNERYTPNSRNIFIDLGTNDGSSLSYFITPVVREEGNESSFVGSDINQQGGRDGGSLQGLGSDGSWHIIAVGLNDYRFYFDFTHITIYFFLSVEANTAYNQILEDYKNESLAAKRVKSFFLYTGTFISYRDIHVITKILIFKRNCYCRIRRRDVVLSR